MPNCRWFGKWRIFPIHEPKILIVVRLLIICLLATVFFAYTGYLINQWYNPVILHRNYWSPRIFSVPPISLEGITSARLANGPNQSSRIDLTNYLRWSTNQENTTQLNSDSNNSSSSGDTLGNSISTAQITLQGEEWWKFGQAMTTSATANKNTNNNGQQPIFVEIDIIATPRDTATATVAITDQPLRLMIRESPQTASLIDSTLSNQMTIEWASAYQIQLTDIRHIDRRSVETRSLMVDGTPYVGPPSDGLALRIRPRNPFIANGHLNDAVNSMDDKHGGYIHGSQETTPDQFIVEVSEDVPRLTALELIGCWGGVGTLILLLYNFLLGSRRLKPWGVVQRYLLPNHMKHAGFLAINAEASGNIEQANRKARNREAGIIGVGPPRAEQAQGNKVPNATGCINKRFFHPNYNRPYPDQRPTNSSPPVTISAASALPPPLQLPARINRNGTGVQSDPSAESCSCPATKSSPAISVHSEPCRWSSAQDRQLYEICNNERINHYAQRAGHTTPREIIDTVPEMAFSNHGHYHGDRIDQELRLHYSPDKDYDPETKCIFHSPVESPHRSSNSPSIMEEPPTHTQYEEPYTETPTDSLRALLDSFVMEVAWIKGLREEWLQMRQGIMEMSSRTVTLEDFQHRLETCYLAQNSFRRRPAFKKTIATSKMTQPSSQSNGHSRVFMAEQGVVVPPPNIVSYPPIVTGTSVTAALYEEESNHIYL
ncbi:hypothetical protein BDF19DRAFT_452229 [Syncephalis fuscata]|nr:hypothetical protein BDF19DRAFT_452229 [Syncephalis fuscata]